MFRFPDEFSGEVTAAWSPNGNRIATNTWNPIEVQIWDVTTHQLLTTLPSGQDGIGTWHYRNTIAWSPDGSLLATLTQGGDVQIWETDTFSLVFELGIGARKGG